MKNIAAHRKTWKAIGHQGQQRKANHFNHRPHVLHRLHCRLQMHLGPRCLLCVAVFGAHRIGCRRYPVIGLARSSALPVPEERCSTGESLHIQLPLNKNKYPSKTLTEGALVFMFVIMSVYKGCLARLALLGSIDARLRCGVRFRVRVRIYNVTQWFDSASIHWFDILIVFIDSIHWFVSFFRFLDSIPWFDALIRFMD